MGDVAGAPLGSSARQGGPAADMLPGRDPRAGPRRAAQIAAVPDHVCREVIAKAAPHMIVRALRGDFRGRDRCINHVCLSTEGSL